MDKYENYLEDDIPIPEAPYADLYAAGFFKPNQKSMKVTIVWDLEFSKYKQIFLLKKLYPNIRDLKPIEMKDIFQKNPLRWTFAELKEGNAKELMGRARKLGLTIELSENS